MCERKAISDDDFHQKNGNWTMFALANVEKCRSNSSIVSLIVVLLCFLFSFSVVLYRFKSHIFDKRHLFFLAFVCLLLLSRIECADLLCENDGWNWMKTRARLETLVIHSFLFCRISLVRNWAHSICIRPMKIFPIDWRSSSEKISEMKRRRLDDDVSRSVFT